jgi:hypothetical protein
MLLSDWEWAMRLFDKRFLNHKDTKGTKRLLQEATVHLLMLHLTGFAENNNLSKPTNINFPDLLWASTYCPATTLG